jgi:hypothetical protein
MAQSFHAYQFKLPSIALPTSKKKSASKSALDVDFNTAKLS